MSVAMRKRGAEGKPCVVITNSFEVTVLPKKKYYQYDDIRPRTKDDKMVNPRRANEIIDRLQSHVAPQIFNPRAVYDGQAIMFASHELQLSGGNSANFAVSMGMKPPPPGAPPRGVFQVKLTRAAAHPIEFSDLDDLIKGRAGPSYRTLTATNLLQLLIRAAPNLIYPHNLRSYYTSVNKGDLGRGLEIWRGFFQSVRPTIGKMLINVDVSISAMYMPGKLIDVALSILGSRGGVRDLMISDKDANLKKLTNTLKNVFVLIGTPNGVSRKKKIRAFVSSAGEFEFHKDGVLTTVKDYYKETYAYTLQYPQMVGVQVGNKSMDIIIPAELCTVVEGQIYKKRVPQELTKKVVSFATQKPAERLVHIKDSHGGVQAPVFEYQTSPFMRDAGMQVSTNPMQIKGRVLPTPRLVYANNQPSNIKNGGWNIMGNKFRTPMNLVVWAVVDYARDKNKTDAFVGMLTTCFNGLGMKHLKPYICPGNGQGNISQDLTDISAAAMEAAGQQVLQMPPNSRPAKPAGVAIIIAILPFPADEIRRAVKHFGDVESGVPTQCIRSDKIQYKERNLNQYCNNVALKINIRLGGENSITSSKALDELQKNKFMIVGADVGHPGAGVEHQPSIASLVWSYDNHAMKYAAFSSVQRPRQEQIDDLESMMKRALDAFGQMQAAPARIVFFRDGLSEGEFEGVGAEEVKAIQAAIDAIWTLRKPPFPKPKLTYIVVGKRHHVRFFPARPNEADNSGNCPAGFVADEGLDNPVAPDFYLQSHGGLLGTSRPSHYIVLKDEIFGGHPDALQQLAYTLCHCYAKATRSVSIPAPVYYADLVCARAKFHFDPDLRYDDSQTVSSGSGGKPVFNITPWKEGYKALNKKLVRSMYFL